MLGICADPAFVDMLDRNCIEVIPALSTAPFDDDEVGLLQHAQVLHDGGAIEVWQQFGKGTRCSWAGLECIKDLAAGFVRQCLEYLVVIHRI